MISASYIKLYVYDLLIILMSNLKKNYVIKYNGFKFKLFMDTKKQQKIKVQEWVVMFDGQIKKSKKEIDADKHHLEVNNQKSE